MTTFPPPIHWPPRAWHLNTLMSSERMWMLKYMERGQAEKAAEKARRIAHYGRILCYLLGVQS